jgi:tripeptide aminopeptidase
MEARGEELIMIDEERLVARFLELARIDSPSGHEQVAGERVMEWLREVGATVDRDPIGNVFGRLDGKGQPLLLNAHLDTVGPAEGVEPSVADGVIHSDGRTVLGADDKSGVAIILEAVRTAQEQGLSLPPLDILFTVQEEVGLAGVKAFDIRRLRAREGIGLDSGGPQGTVVLSAPSQDSLHVVVHGVAAHAGAEPEKGVSAIVAAAEAITRMPLGRIDEETTANIGVISGGKATNIVCDRVEVRGEARSREPAKLVIQTQAMVSAFEEAAAHHGATADIEVTHPYTGYSLEREAPLIRLLADAATKVGLEPNCIESGGGSDANVLNAAGVRITNISTGMAQVHTTEERISIVDMVRCAEWLLAALRLRAGAEA